MSPLILIVLFWLLDTKYGANANVDVSNKTELIKLNNQAYVLKAKKNHSASMIFVHDWGEHGSWWHQEIYEFQPLYLKVVCPQANRRVVEWKNSNMSTFFDFQGDTQPRYSKVTDEMQWYIDYIHKLIEKEIEDGIPAERIIISGIHQGAIMAFHVAFTFPKKLAGIIAYSPWHKLAMNHEEYSNMVNKDIPIYIASVDGNHYTNNHKQEELVDQLKNHFSKNVTLKLYEGKRCTHDDEFIDAADIVKKFVPPV